LFHKPLDWHTIKTQCEIVYEDGTSLKDIYRDGDLNISYLGEGEDIIGTWESDPDGMKDWNWLIKGVETNKPIKNIILSCPERNWEWQSNGWGWKLAVEKTNDGLKISGGNPLPGLKLRIISPSCHDCGWDTFPLDKNPYTVQGSRHIMGYGTLLAPAIPIFMSGEEFDAEYIPLPKHTPDLYGKGEPGKGRWLYASWIQWDQVKEDRHRAMLKDVKRMIEIRHNHTDLIHAPTPGKSHLKMQGVPVQSEEIFPVPYVLSNSERAILIAGNPKDTEINVKAKLTLSLLNLPKDTKNIKVTELWPVEIEPQILSLEELSDYQFTISADLQPGGGLHVVRFEPTN